MRFQLRINGETRDVDVPPGTSLLGVLRDDLTLTGTRYGCGKGLCGACFVLADGKAVASCLLSVEEAENKDITTIEGLESGGELHPVQAAFIEEDAMQCGYCIPGMIISAVALTRSCAKPTEDQIRDALAPNLCRCGVYMRAVRAVRKASE